VLEVVEALHGGRELVLARVLVGVRRQLRDLLLLQVAERVVLLVFA